MSANHVTVFALTYTVYLCYVKCSSIGHILSPNCSTTRDPTTGYVISLDCRSRGLDDIDPAWFPENITTLILDNNPLSVLRNDTFQHLGRLNTLSVKKCGLKSLEGASLRGLTRLETLDLSNNRELNVSRLPARVFSHTPALAHLVLRFTLCSDLPVDELTGLRELDIESCSELKIPESFHRLKDLRVLRVGGDALRTIRNSSLNPLSSLNLLEEFVLCDGTLRFTHFENGVFEPLRSLRKLRLDFIHIGNKNAFSSLWPFENKSLDLIQFRHTFMHPFSDTFDFVKDGCLTAHDLRYIKTIALTQLELSYCRLFAIDPTMFRGQSNLRKTLKRLLTETDTLVYTDQYRSGLWSTLVLPHIQDITLSTGKFDFRSYLSEASSIVKKYVPNIPNPDSADVGTRKPITTQSARSKRRSLIIYTQELKALRFFNLNSYVTLETTITFQNGYNIHEMFFVNVHADMYEPINNVDSVRLLDLSGSTIWWRDNVLFDSFRGIFILRMNRFQRMFFFTEWSHMLFTSGLKNLTYFEVGSNRLTHIPKDIFSPNTRLSHLGLFDNRFSEIPVDLSTVPTLKSLDLRGNSVLFLDTESREQLDQRVMEVGHFNLDLSGNPLLCGCEQLSFVGWLKSTLVTLDQRNYTCVSQDSLLTSIDQLDPEAMWREWVGPLAFWVSQVVLCVMVIGFLMVYMWGKLKTVIQALMFSVFVPDFRLKNRRDYKHDVFLGYADDDFRFVRRVLLPLIEDELGLPRTFVHQRDLRAGYVDEQLLGAMRHSWRIVLVVTPNFIYSYDKAHFIMAMSTCCVSCENPRRVLTVADERLTHRLTQELLAVIPQDQILTLSTWNIQLTHAQKARLKAILKQN